MSKTKTGIAVMALVLSSLACAQQGYVGIGAGESDTNVGGDARKTAYKLFAGYDFNRNWAIEGAWADLGKPQWPQGESRETAWYLAGKGTVPISSQFDLFAKLGASWNKVALNDTKKTDLLAGVGAEYLFNKQLGLRLEYEDFGKFGDDNIGRHRANMWTLGLDYKMPAKF
ncbi:MAG: outer membrane beta-barrel protein [Rhodocyclaceae bacterium]|nr:outer membrane beta-barrel protein [Rhodocyclaceae bacterium]